MKKGIVLIVGLLLLLSVANTEGITNRTPSVSEPMGQFQGADYVDHPKVTVNSDADFPSQGFTGSGTESDPYVLEGKRIFGGNTTHLGGISIRNTRSYFEVRDCIVNLTCSIGAIDLVNVSQGNIADCIIQNATKGIGLGDLSHVTLMNNRIIECGYGMSISESNNMLCHNNTIIRPTIYPIYVSGLSFANFTQNKILHFDGPGIWLTVSNHVRLQGNYILNVSYGIRLGSEAHWTYVDGNTIENVSRVGVYLHGGGVTRNVTVVNNHLKEANIELVDCKNLTVMHNRIESFSKSGSFGIWVDGANSVVHNNTIQHCYLGLSIDQYTRHSKITNNTISFCEHGLEVQGIGSMHSQFYYNTFTNNTEHAYDGCSDNIWDDGVYLGNYWDDWDGEGVYSIQGSGGSVDRYPLGPTLTTRLPPVTTTTTEPSSSTTTTSGSTSTNSTTDGGTFPVELSILSAGVAVGVVMVIVVAVRRR